MNEPIVDQEKTTNDYQTQKNIVKLYAKYVNKPKTEFFKSLGLGVVQGKRNGIYISTIAGNRKKDPPVEFIDCRTSGGVFNFGHHHPKLVKILNEALDLGLDIGDHHMISEQRALLARDLAEILPGEVSKTQFCVGGGEAIDLSLKLARAFTKRKKIVSAKRAYHGVTGLAMSVGSERFYQPFQTDISDFIHVPFGDIDKTLEAIDETTAAVILETIPATGGILIPPPGYLSAVKQKCEEKGALYIADEVQAGLGRTGELWGVYGGIYPEEKVVPDIIVLAKGMSAGLYPLATCSYRPEIESVFAEDPFLHISTTGGSELGCYVTRKMLEMLTAPGFLQNVKARGRELQAGLLEIQQMRPDIVREVRGRGLMWGLEFISDRLGIGYTLHMLQNGIFADYCGNNEATIKLMPPLITTSEEIEEIITRLKIAMEKLPSLKN